MSRGCPALKDSSPSASQPAKSCSARAGLLSKMSSASMDPRLKVDLNVERSNMLRAKSVVEWLNYGSTGVLFRSRRTPRVAKMHGPLLQPTPYKTKRIFQRQRCLGHSRNIGQDGGPEGTRYNLNQAALQAPKSTQVKERMGVGLIVRV